MKTPQRKYTLIRHYDKDNIVSVGISRWITKYTWWICVWFVVFMGVGLSVDTWTPKHSIWQYLVSAPFLVSFIWGYWKAYQNGKKLFNKVKDLPEPIDLDSIK
jgi:hypothetical protein